MSLLVNREVLLCKVESTYNTDPTPAASADEVLVENLAWAPEGARAIERKPVRASIGALQQIYGGTLVTLTFDTEIKGSGAAGTAPEINALLEGCGMLGANTPATSEVYAPASTGHTSVTFWYYQDGTLMKITGCRGNFVITMEAGARGMISWTFTGHLTTVTDVGIATPSYSSTVPVAALGTTFTVAGFSAVINSITIDMNNQLATPPSLAASDGFSEVRIVGRDVQGSFDPEYTTVSDNPWIADWQGDVTGAIAIGTTGATAGNIFKIDMPVVAFRNISPGDRDGVRTLEVPYGATESSGDDDVSITFT